MLEEIFTWSCRNTVGLRDDSQQTETIGSFSFFLDFWLSDLISLSENETRLVIFTPRQTQTDGDVIRSFQEFWVVFGVFRGGAAPPFHSSFDVFPH